MKITLLIVQSTHKTYEVVRSLGTSTLPAATKLDLEKKGDLASKAQFAMGMQNVKERK